MRRSVILLACMLCSVLLRGSMANAAGTPVPPTGPDWKQYDTAVYVVSTLNLLHTKAGRSVTPLFKRKLNVSRFEVWEDLKMKGLYFIQLTRDDSTVAGAVAYQLGWVLPRSLTTSFDRYGMTRAPTQVVDAFRSDPKRLLAAFTSTRP